MEIDFDKIVKLRKLRVEKSKLSEKEMELSTPQLSEWSLINDLYVKFTNKLKEKGEYRITSVTQRQKFIFIILFLYSPSTLAGGKMPKGLRECICKVMDMKSASVISHDLDNVVFLYQNYMDFRKEVNELFGAMMGESC